MAFTPEDGTGLEDANSYVDVAFADEYFADRGTPTAWSDANQTAKEQALVKATDHITKRFGGRFLGQPKTDTQALPWPRENQPFGDMPQPLLKATVEYALRSMQADLEPVPDGNPGRVASEEQTVGPITTKTSYHDRPATRGGSATLEKGTIPAVPSADLMIERVIQTQRQAVRN